MAPLVLNAFTIEIDAPQARPENQFFYNAFKAIPIGVALEDLEGRPLFVNPALCSMLGFSEEEMRGKHCVDFSPREDAGRDWPLFQQLRAGSIEDYDIDKRFIRRDGSLVWGRLSISFLEESGSPMVVAMQDITETKSAQETLDLATKGMMGVTRCSRDFRYLWANQGYADLLQRPLGEIVGHNIVDVLGLEAFEALRSNFERALAGETITFEEEVNYQSVGRRWISATYTPTLAPNGVVDGWVAVIMDITERKLAEEAISKVSQKLIQAQKEERSRIARQLHDDINQRLAILVATLEELKRDLPSSVEQLERHIQTASGQIADIRVTVQSLSHRLHSPKLELLGLGAAASSLCKEISHRQNLEIDFQAANIPRNLPDNISLCRRIVANSGFSLAEDSQTSTPFTKHCMPSFFHRGLGCFHRAKADHCQRATTPVA